MDPSSPRVVNQHVAGVPSSSPEPAAVTHTMSPRKGQLNVHSGPEVQQFGHAIVGDGRAISDVVDGKIMVKGASSPRPAAAAAGGHSGHLQPKEYLHDGTTYATGATDESHDAGSDRPGLMTRVKEAVPGTREHQQKKEREDGLAVYM